MQYDSGAQKGLGFIGGGNMATSLIGGILNGGHDAKHISVYEPNQAKAQALAQTYGIYVATNNADLVARSHTIVIAVKPQVLQQVLTPLQADVARSQPLIISIVAGISAASINTWLAGEFSVIRVMPNTPALVGAGASGLFATNAVSQQQRALAESLLATVGVCAWVNSEQDIDSVTALSGSGPAYFMLFVKSLIDAGVQAGLSAETSKLLAVSTCKGAAELIAASDVDLQTLINNVTSPKGTTEQALKTFEELNLESIVHAAFNAAKHRSAELAEELG